MLKLLLCLKGLISTWLAWISDSQVLFQSSLSNLSHFMWFLFSFSWIHLKTLGLFNLFLIVLQCQLSMFCYWEGQRKIKNGQGNVWVNYLWLCCFFLVVRIWNFLNYRGYCSSMNSVVTLLPLPFIHNLSYYSSSLGAVKNSKLGSVSQKWSCCWPMPWRLGCSENSR